MADEIKTLNGYKLADEVAREQAKTNAEAIAAINKKMEQQHFALEQPQNDAVQRFASLFQHVEGSSESFLFFADPHLCGAEKVSGRFEPWLNQIATVYNGTPTSLCVCAGDWLSSGNTRENACWILGVIDGAMKARFNNYISVLGNHDTNYQGYEYIETGREDKTYDRNECAKCQLSTAAVRTLWYRKQKNAYFAIDGDCTRIYVFDSGLDWYREMTEYRWAQAQWFAQALLEEKPRFAAIVMHIATATFADHVLKIASAYNHHSKITVNGVEYDFENSTGTVGFALAGHEHCDYAFTWHDIPVVITANLKGTDDQPRFDLVLVDWEAGKLHMTRVGEGKDRTIELAGKL